MHSQSAFPHFEFFFWKYSESGHCQGACRSQRVFYILPPVGKMGPPINVVIRATGFLNSLCEGREKNPLDWHGFEPVSAMVHQFLVRVTKYSRVY